MDSDTATESNITIILEQSICSIAKDVGPFSRRFNAKHRQTFHDLVNVYVFDIGSTCIHGKNYSEFLHFIKNTLENFPLKQMFDISEKFDSRDNEMSFLECHQSTGKSLHGNNFLWSVMKKSSVFPHEKVYVFFFFSDSVICFGKVSHNPQRNIVWENSWVGSKIHHNTELRTQLTENRWNSSGILSQDSPHCSSSTKSKSS